MRPKGFVRLAAALSVPLLAAGVVVAGAGAASADDGWHHSHVLYVSAGAKHWNSDRSCRSAKFTTIQSAVNAARPGGTVVVCPGTYHEQVVISKPLTLKGKHATIDENGVNPGFQVTLPGLGTQTIFAAVVMDSSRINFTGFTVQNAQGEGIVAAGLNGPVSHIVISRNAVVNNDLGGGVPPASDYFLCQPAGPVPGDCGEGVHFAGNIGWSTIRDNLITHNSGGVLLTDDIGPTHNNVVAGNVVTANLFDCGITVPGHNSNALSSTGVRQPSVAGVYGNVIKNNVVTGNGVLGEGAGVLFANAGPGTASYNNLVEGNFIAGNSLAGVTMHAHTLPPGLFEDLNGNVIVHNSIGKNNLLGDELDGPPGPSVTAHTGVLVFSGGTPVAVRIAHNHIFNNDIGIWLSKPVTASGLGTNRFTNVTTPVSANN
jgi:hypothetical protein